MKNQASYPEWFGELEEVSDGFASDTGMRWGDESRVESVIEQLEEFSSKEDPSTTTPRELTREHDPLRETTEPEGKGESHSDVGFFLSLAGRYPLLNAEQEKELATTLWRARRRLFRAIESARRSRRSSPLKVPVGRNYRSRIISPEARRRLIAAEDYAERLLRLVDEKAFLGERFDRSLS